MKIVTWEEFRELPTGTVFQKYEPNCFEEVLIKDDNCGDFDFFYSDLDSLEIAEDETTERKSFEKLNNGDCVNKEFETTCRDGLFEYDQLYAVWSKEDIKALIAKLEKSI